MSTAPNGKVQAPVIGAISENLKHITCFNCGQKGHRKVDCPFPPKRRGAHQGTCNHCGLYGHKEEDCWYKTGNNTKKPNGWRPNMEVMKKIEEKATTTTNDSDLDAGMISLTMYRESQVLKRVLW